VWLKQSSNPSTTTKKTPKQSNKKYWSLGKQFGLDGDKKIGKNQTIDDT
jgi:hypothetical protein